MGGCCAVEKSDTLPTGGPLPPGAIDLAATHKLKSDKQIKSAQSELEHFEAKIKSDLPILVVLSDGTQLACSLKYNDDDKTLIIYCETNVRIIQLSEIAAIMHGPEQLKRVETRAKIANDPK